MSNLMISLQVVLNMAIPLAIGVFLRWRKLLRPDFNRVVNDLIYYVSLPGALCLNVYKSDLFRTRFPGTAVAAEAGLLVLSFVLLMLIVPRFVKQPGKAATIVQSFMRGNASIYGLAIGEVLFPGAALGNLALLVTLGVMLFNILSVMGFELSHKKDLSAKALLLSVLKNPLLIAIFIGIALNALRTFTQYTIPDLVLSPLKSVGSITTPLCFVGIGSTVSFRELSKEWKPLTVVVAGKLFLMPLAALSLALALGMRGELLAAYLAVFATPCAVGSFALAEKKKGDGSLAAGGIMLTTTLSIITLFFWIFLLKSLQAL